MRRSTRLGKRDAEANEGKRIQKTRKREESSDKSSSEVQKPLFVVKELETEKKPNGDSERADGCAWVHSCFPEAKRLEWNSFLQSKCFLRVPDEVYDLFELAVHLRPDKPLDAFVAALGIRLSGIFDLLAAGAQVTVDKPVYLQGRFYYDPPEVATMMIDVESDSGTHWGYFRDSPDEIPPYVVYTQNSATCVFVVAGTSLFDVLDKQILFLHHTSASRQNFQEVQTMIAQYLKSKDHNSQSISTLRRRRMNESTAPSLHRLGIVVPCDEKKQTGYRELPIIDEQLKKLLAQFRDNNDDIANARKKLSELITRATIASDELDFGTGLLLGLDLFTVGACLEKETLQLLKIAYMLLGRFSYYKILSAHVMSRSVDHPIQCLVTDSSSVDHHSTTVSRPKLTVINLPKHG